MILLLLLGWNRFRPNKQSTDQSFITVVRVFFNCCKQAMRRMLFRGRISCCNRRRFHIWPTLYEARLSRRGLSRYRGRRRQYSLGAHPRHGHAVDRFVRLAVSGYAVLGLVIPVRRRRHRQGDGRRSDAVQSGLVHTPLRQPRRQLLPVLPQRAQVPARVRRDGRLRTRLLPRRSPVASTPVPGAATVGVGLVDGLEGGRVGLPGGSARAGIVGQGWREICDGSRPE